MSTLSSPASRGGQSKGGIFSQKTLLIVVGPERVPFHIHPVQLSSTAFFEVHGDPHTSNAREEQASSETTRATTPAVEVKEESERSPTIRSSTLDREAGPPAIADYVLLGQVFEPEAFEVIVGWLYNQPPEAPKNRKQCKISLRAYVIALRYKMGNLQDCLVDNFRKWHQEYDISFEDFTWLVNRLGDFPECRNIPLIRYLADQIAFEITSAGYEKFIDNNPLFYDFLTKGDRNIRALVFECIVIIARVPPYDPAHGPNRWTIASCPVAGRPPPDTNMVYLA